APGTQRPGLEHTGLGPGGLACETAPYAVDPHPGDHRDPVPLVDAPVRYLVSGGLEGQERKLLVGALGFLDGQDVHVMAFQPAQHTLGPGPDGIHVPGSDSHGATVARKVVRWDTQGGSANTPGRRGRQWRNVARLSLAALATRGSPGSNQMWIVAHLRRGRGPLRCGPEPPPRGGAGRRRAVRTGPGEVW